MMCGTTTLYLALGVTLALVRDGLGLKCYLCDHGRTILGTYYDPNIGNEWCSDPFTGAAVSATCDGADYCGKIVTEAPVGTMDTVTVNRFCGSFRDNPNAGNGCMDQSIYSDVTLTGCACFEDLCNGAQVTGSLSGVALLTGALLSALLSTGRYM